MQGKSSSKMSSVMGLAVILTLSVMTASIEIQNKKELNKNSKVWGIVGPNRYLTSSPLIIKKVDGVKKDAENREKGKKPPHMHHKRPIAQFIIGADTPCYRLESRLKLRGVPLLKWHQLMQDISILTVPVEWTNQTNYWLQAQPDIVYHDFYHPPEPHIKWALHVMKGDPQTTPHTLTGKGVTTAVMDTGLDTQYHPGLQKMTYTGLNQASLSPLLKNAQQGAYVNLEIFEDGLTLKKTDFDDPPDGHGTHVAGAAIQKSRLLFVDLSNEEDESLKTPILLGPLLETLYQGGARVFTNSWGTQQNWYTFQSMEIDNFMFTHDDAIVLFSAGNSGPDSGTIGSPATSKNCIAIGASQNHHLSFLGVPENHLSIKTKGAPFKFTGHEENLADFSSRGPTQDGRQKPDFVAPGEFILSDRAHPNRTLGDSTKLLMRGTSMSSPIAAEVAAQFKEYKVHSTSHLFKAAMAVMAVDLKGRSAKMSYSQKEGGYIGIERPIKVRFPDEGFGRISMKETDLPHLCLKDRIPIEEFTEGEKFIFRAEKDFLLMIAISWLDPPVLPYHDSVLVNDLDLRVWLDNKTLYLGNQHKDPLNNLERVKLRVRKDQLIEVQITAQGHITLPPTHKTQFFSLALFPNFLTPLQTKKVECNLKNPLYPCQLNSSSPQMELGLTHCTLGGLCMPKCAHNAHLYLNGKCQCVAPYQAEDGCLQQCVGGRLMDCVKPEQDLKRNLRNLIEEKKTPLRRHLDKVNLKPSLLWYLGWLGVGALTGFFIYTQKRQQYKIMGRGVRWS